MRLYRALLWLYPASFRHEYGEELCEIHRQRRRDASGVAGRVALWMENLVELPINALQAHGDLLRQDLRYTLRTLHKAPGFTLTAILVLALGIGATTASFSVTYHVLMRPLPYAHPEQIVRLWANPPGYWEEVSPANYRDWKTWNSSFESMGAYSGMAVNLVGRGEPRRLEMAKLTPEVLPVLGVRPLLGRAFSDQDDREGTAGTLLLSYGYWKSGFGGDPGVLGTKVLLDGAPYEILGVMPAGFYFPTRQTLAWAPLAFTPEDFEDRGNNYLRAVARVRSGVSVEQARSEMKEIAARLEREHPAENEKVGILVNRVQDEISGQSRMMLLVLLGASLCLLLIACTNLANLMLARALGRRKELALRSALGAGRERLTRQLLTESLCLAAAGGAAGVLVAKMAMPLLTRLVPENLPIGGSPSLDSRVLCFALALSFLTGIVFGILPAFRTCREAAVEGLREHDRAGGGRKQRSRSVLVVVEVTASVVLLVSAGLLLRALHRLQAVDPGFRTEGVLTLRTALPLPKYEATATRHAFYTQVLSEVRALPGVESAAYITYLPMLNFGGGIWPVAVEGRPPDPQREDLASARFVTSGFFASMGIPLVQGRDVSESDTQQAAFVAVVSESLARRYWPDQDPIGRVFKFGPAQRRIVGVVRDIRVRGLQISSEPQVYLPSQQVADGSVLGYTPKDLVVRSRVEPATLLPALRRIVHRADPEQPISDVQRLSELVDGQTAPRRSQLGVIGAFAILAFLLAGVGIHGLLSYAVSQRTREIGVRLALGARRTDILRMVMRSGFVLAATGILLGVVLAYAAARAIQTLLFEVTAYDVPTYLAAGGLALLMALVGSLLPALRAIRVNPISALRSE